MAGLGAFLWGAPVAAKAMEIALDPLMVKWCVIIGLIANAGGVFFMGLFGRDNNVTSEDVKSAQADKNGNLSLWLLTGLLALGCTGCLAPRVAPGSDPVVVNAEQFRVQATKTLDEFIQWVDRNPGLGSDVIAARAIAAESGPVYIRALRTAIRTYKAARTPENSNQVQQSVDSLQELLNLIRNTQTKSP